jgi:hypothetical protein
MNAIRIALALVAALPLLGALAPAGRAADPPRSPCATDRVAQPATPPARGPDAGTAPGGMGSTGWSGGTGGSYIGTSPAGATSASPNAQPPTAQGLDPTRPPAAPRTEAC